MRQLTPKPLTQVAFSVFGDVLDLKNAKKSFSMNYELATRHYDLAEVDVADHGGEPCISLVKSKAVTLPFEVKVMEYHPFGSQIFHPLGDVPFLVLVAPPSEKLDLDMLELFITNGKQGVNYHKGVWHHYLIPLKNDSEFIVIDRKANDNNCIETELDKSITIEI